MRKDDSMSLIPLLTSFNWTISLSRSSTIFFAASLILLLVLRRTLRLFHVLVDVHLLQVDDRRHVELLLLEPAAKALRDSAEISGAFSYMVSISCGSC